MICVVGGTGLLGSELYKIDNSLICLGSEYDIFNFSKLKQKLEEINPEIIINCAAKLTLSVDENPIDAININIIGSSNLAKYCLTTSKRLVYISTDYVYPGVKGNYNEDDYLLPHNNYAWTKLSGEVPVRLVQNHLIIRTSFGSSIFPNKKAFDNLFSSKDYVDIIAPMILKASKSDTNGVINIGTEKKSIFQYANMRNEIESFSLEKERDFSLDISKFKKIENK